jgi:hypothetical protein
MNDSDRFSLPTSLMAIPQVEMSPEMMEAVQLRYKYCKKKHQNHHFPMTNINGMRLLSRTLPTCHCLSHFQTFTAAV